MSRHLTALRDCLTFSDSKTGERYDILDRMKTALKEVRRAPMAVCLVAKDAISTWRKK
jgi:hypothetical protein